MPSSAVNTTDRFVADALQAACLMEATARKPGNVHPEASFADLTYEHFRLAAEVAAPIVAMSGTTGVGQSVKQAVEATLAVAPSNANLGIVLLLAPLAAVPTELSLAAGISGVLDRLSVDDARHVYAAIRLANPGGMGRVSDQDVAETPTGTLRDVMALAAERDRIARQYMFGFADVLEFALPRLACANEFENRWEQAIIRLHLELLAEIPDSLIARKCGSAIAGEASQRARHVLDAGWPDAPGAAQTLNDFDSWLRADGNRRNPGTTADLVAAALFAAFRERVLTIPMRFVNALSVSHSAAPHG